MQQLAIATVHFITKQRRATPSKVGPNLVGSAGMQLNSHSAGPRCGREAPVFGHGRLPGRSNHPLDKRGGIPLNRRIQIAMLSDCPTNQSFVLLKNLVCL